jgi:hypothetical protein
MIERPMLSLLSAGALATNFTVTSMGYTTFRMECNDSIQFSQDGFSSFLVFDTNVANSVMFVYNTQISIPDTVVYSISVSGSPRMLFLKTLATTVAIFTVPANRCGPASRSISGIASVSCAFNSNSATDFCLFPLSTNYSESIRVDPPGLSTFFVFGRPDGPVSGPSLTTRSPFSL